MLRPALSALLVAALLAGCADDAPASPGDGAAAAGMGASTAGGGNATDPGAAPVWQVGQTWKHDWTIGGSTAFDSRSVVVAAGGDGYRLASDDHADAVNHAAFFFHNLGQMDKDWSIHQQQYAFPWYDFPLADGKTWTAHEENIDFNLGAVSRDLTMTARLVNASGNVPAHYAIEQRTSDGGLRAKYDYRSDVGWFHDLQLFDPAAPDSPPQVTLTTTSWGKGWTGTYYEATSDFLLNTFSFVSPAGGAAQPQPPTSFAVTADHTDVLAIVFAFAAAGGSAAELVAPDGQHWEANHVADQDGNTLYGNGGVQVQVPAVAGEWRVAWAGASPFAAGGGAFAWGVTVTEATL